MSHLTAIVARRPGKENTHSLVYWFRMDGVEDFCGGWTAHRFRYDSLYNHVNPVPLQDVRAMKAVELQKHISRNVIGEPPVFFQICGDEPNAVLNALCRIWLGGDITNLKAGELHFFDIVGGSNPLEQIPDGEYVIPNIPTTKTSRDADDNFITATILVDVRVSLERRQFTNYNSGNSVQLTQLIYNGKV